MKYLILLFLCLLTLNAQYQVSTYAGSDSGYVNGRIDEALFNHPFGICIDSEGNIYIADSGNNCIRKIDTNGVVTTLAGNGNQGLKDGTAWDAEFNSPTGICTDNKGNFFIVDFLNQAIRKLDAEGKVTTLAGNGEVGFAEGRGKEARFNYPRGITINSEGDLFVSDSWNHRIRKITQEGIVMTFAGGGKGALVNEFGDNDSDYGTYKDGPDTTARFHTPCGLSIDNQNNIYVADALNHMIRKITIEGYVTTIAGNGGPGFTDGEAIISNLNTPTEVFVDSDGGVFFSDTYNNAVRKITTNEQLITIAGTGKAGLVDGSALESQMNYPRGIIANKDNTAIYFVDHYNNRIRIITKN